MRPTLRQDLAWGLTRGLFAIGIIMTPATAVFLMKRGSRDLSLFLSILAAYVVFGAAVGIVAGVFRAKIGTRGGATIFGLCMGIVTSGALLLALRPPGEPFNAKVDLFFGFLCAGAGAGLGRWFWTVHDHFFRK